MRRDVLGTPMIIDYYIGIAPELKGDTMPDASDGLRLVIREPLGVAVSYAASNHPFLFSIQRTIGALLAGNPLVLRAHEADSSSPDDVGGACGGDLPARDVEHRERQGAHGGRGARAASRRPTDHLHRQRCGREGDLQVRRGERPEVGDP